MSPRQGITFYCLAALSISLWVIFFPKYGVGAFNDDGLYYLGAQSFYRVGYYADLCTPDFTRQTHFFPGYPVLLSLTATLFPKTPQVSQVLSWIFLIGSMMLIRRLFSKEFPSSDVMWVLILFATNPRTIFYSIALMSEMPYLFFSLLTIYGVYRQFNSLWLSLLLAFTCLIRPIGIFLVMAIIISLWSNKERKKSLGILLTVGFILLPFIIWLKSASGPIHGIGYSGMTPQTYFGELKSHVKFIADYKEFFSVLWAKAVFYLSACAAILFLPIMPHGWSIPSDVISVLEILFLGLSMVGYLSLPKSRLKTIMGLYLFLSILFYLVWKGQAQRFLFPFYPFLLFFIVSSITNLSLRFPAFPKRVVLCFMLLFNLLSLYVWGYNKERNFLFVSIPKETFSWIKDHTEKEAVFASDMVSAIKIHTDRWCFQIPGQTAPDDFFYVLMMNKVGYLLLNEGVGHVPDVGHGSYAGMEDAVQAAENRLIKNNAFLEKVYKNPEEGTAIFKLNRENGNYIQAIEVSKTILFKKDQPKIAITELETLCRREPSLYNAKNTLGVLCIQNGKKKEGARMFSELARDWSGYPLAHLNLAKSLRMSGDMKGAYRELKIARELAGPTSDGIKEDKEVLTESDLLLAQLKDHI